MKIRQPKKEIIKGNLSDNADCVRMNSDYIVGTVKFFLFGKERL